MLHLLFYSFLQLALLLSWSNSCTKKRATTVRAPENPAGNNAKKTIQPPEPLVGESREKPNTIGEGGITPSQDECLRSKEDNKDKDMLANQNSKQIPTQSPAPDFEQAFAAIKDGKSREKSKFLIDTPSLVDAVDRSSAKLKSNKMSNKDKHSSKDKHTKKEPQTPKTALGKTPVNEDKPVTAPKMQIGVPVKVQIKEVPPKEDRPKSQFLDGVAPANGAEAKSIFLVPK